jgi:SAM-dependent MidA family methyltransferase
MKSTSSQDGLTLVERLRERIRREGAITFRDWMAFALYDEREGYYSRPDMKRWGRSGDYRTAPERSPLFSATFARYFAQLHEELGAPREWTIFEAGAGAGHFAHGVLQTLEQIYPRVFNSTRYVIDEISPDAQRRAASRLEPFSRRVEFARFTEINTPVPYGIVFSNELLDAFPVHRVTMREGRLLEFYVELDEEGGFAWVKREASTPLLAEHFARSALTLSEGQIAEVNLDIERWMAQASALFQQGYIVTVDYGDEENNLYDASQRPTGTLRSFHRHRLTDDVLAQPGVQDLTTTVNWTAVKRIGEELGLQTVCFERQDEFLLRGGLLNQLERMTGESGSEAEALILRSGVRDLILPGGMSESFQVLVQRKL